MMLCWLAIPFFYFLCAYVWMCVNVVTRARVHACCVYKCEYVCTDYESACGRQHNCVRVDTEQILDHRPCAPTCKTTR